MKKVQIIILAAGNGTRMKSALPKSLIPIKGKPIVERLVHNCIQSGLTEKPVVIVSEKNKNQIKKALGNVCFYVVQKKQLGTGHAVLCAKKLLKDKYEVIVVLNGDHPFVKAQTLKKLVSLINKEKKSIAMATTRVPNFSGWRKTFFDFGRIIRNKKGDIREIVEKRDASKKQLEVREVNVAYYCFDAKWLWKNLSKIKNNNSQKEYYITDIVKLAINNKQEVSYCLIEAQEGLGVNTPEQLAFAQKLSAKPSAK